MKKRILELLAFTCVLISMMSCATSTKVSIYTDVEGADVYIDNKKIGQTPILKYKMGNCAWKDEQIRIRKPGYEEINQKLQKETKIWNAIGGYFFLIPLLWCEGPVAEQYYLLDPIKE